MTSAGCAPARRKQSHDYAYCLYRNSGLAKTRVRSFYYDPPLHASMVRGERYKLVVYHALAPGETHEGQLFDMENDPQETHNLWDDPAHAAARRELTERLLDWQVQQDVRYLSGRGGHSLPPWWTGKTKDWN